MTQEELQKYWDACLIKEWRNHGNINSAESMFKSIVGEYPREYPELLRVPKQGMPRKITMRVFVANDLPLISEKLWAQKPEKDIDLLRALQKSGYTIHKSPVSEMQKERNNLYAKNRKNRLRMGIETLAVSTRNRKTDWNIVK